MPRGNSVSSRHAFLPSTVDSIMEPFLCGSMPRVSTPVSGEEGRLYTVALTLELTSALGLFLVVIRCQGPMSQGHISISGSSPGTLGCPHRS